MSFVPVSPDGRSPESMENSLPLFALFDISPAFEARLNHAGILQPGDLPALATVSLNLSRFVRYAPFPEFEHASLGYNNTAFRSSTIGSLYRDAPVRRSSLILHGYDPAASGDRFTLYLHGRVLGVPPEALYNPYSIRLIKSPSDLIFGLDVAFDHGLGKHTVHLNVDGEHFRLFLMDAGPRAFRRFRLSMAGFSDNLQRFLSGDARSALVRYRDAMLRDIFRQ